MTKIFTPLFHEFIYHFSGSLIISVDKLANFLVVKTTSYILASEFHMMNFVKVYTSSNVINDFVSSSSSTMALWPTFEPWPPQQFSSILLYFLQLLSSSLFPASSLHLPVPCPPISYEALQPFFYLHNGLPRLSLELAHHRRPSDSMRACHEAGPGSIPGRDKFPE